MTLEQFCKMVKLAPRARHIPIVNLFEVVDGELRGIDYFAPLTDLNSTSHRFDRYRNYEVVSFPASSSFFGVAVQAPQNHSELKK